MKKKICLLHGALNNSNFGDFLFGSLFYNTCRGVSPKDGVYFVQLPKYGVGEAFRQEMNYRAHYRLKDFFDADTLVYISGGYFGERVKSQKETLKRWFRYAMIGRVAMIMKKRILILGVGGGPLYGKGLRKSICRIMDYADIVTVRDEETKQYFTQYGVKRYIEVTFDTALSVTKDHLPELDSDVSAALNKIFIGKKILLVHLSDHKETDALLEEKLTVPVNSFLDNHPEYGVLFSYDGVEDTPIVAQSFIHKIHAPCRYIYRYSGAWQFCALLNRVDFIITPKLHVGIVSSTLGKSVVAVPFNSGKVARFYKQIGEYKRCVPLTEVTDSGILKTLEIYHDKNICISDEIRIKAASNLEKLREYLISGSES